MTAKDDFFEALISGDVPRAEQLYRENEFPGKITGSSVGGTHALMYALKLGAHELAEDLIVHGADVNARHEGNFTPMFVAKDVESVELLMAHNANPNVAITIGGGDDNLTEGSVALHRAAASGDLGLIRALVKAGADISATDKDGATPLHYAARSSVEAVTELVAAGASLDATDKEGRSARAVLSTQFPTFDTERREPSFLPQQPSAPADVLVAVDKNKDAGMAIGDDKLAEAWGKAREMFAGNGIEQGGDRAPKELDAEEALIASLDERMAKAQMEEWGWRDRDDLDTIMRDMETLASSNWTKAAELWDKYNPDDLDKPIFIDGDDVDVPAASLSDENSPGGKTARKSRGSDGVHPNGEREEEAPTKEFLTPDGLRKRYIEADQKFYYREDKNKLAFEDKGRRLATKHDDPEVAKAMVELAESKNWTSIKLKGSEEFKRTAWLEASLRGMQVEGYKPKDVDIAKFEELRTERDSKALNTIEKGRDIAAPSRDATQRKSREPANDKSAVVDENRETLTDKQRVAVDTLKSILRDRGDSEQAVQMAADLATERFHNNRVYVGKVVDFGAAPYDNDKKNEESFFVTLETPKGEKQVWGVDLERAVQAGEVQKGQEVAVAYQGSQQVTVPVKERDAQGKLTGKIAEVTTNRNTWDINRLDRLQATVKERMNIAATETDRVQPVVKIFDRDAERSTERTVVLPEKGRERERARG